LEPKVAINLKTTKPVRETTNMYRQAHGYPCEHTMDAIDFINLSIEAHTTDLDNLNNRMFGRHIIRVVLSIETEPRQSVSTIILSLLGPSHHTA
jgi:hypothetical protein